MRLHHFAYICFLAVGLSACTAASDLDVARDFEDPAIESFTAEQTTADIYLLSAKEFDENPNYIPPGDDNLVINADLFRFDVVTASRPNSATFELEWNAVGDVRETFYIDRLYLRAADLPVNGSKISLSGDPENISSINAAAIRFGVQQGENTFLIAPELSEAASESIQIMIRRNGDAIEFTAEINMRMSPENRFADSFPFLPVIRGIIQFTKKDDAL